MGEVNPSIGKRCWRQLRRYLLDTTVLIAHLRGESDVTQLLLDLLATGSRLGICCVNVAEVERGLRPQERKRAKVLIERLEYFDTTREAARRAGTYQARLQRQGLTLHTPEAIVAERQELMGRR